ncbi:MAG: hypothetical protein M3O09_01860 [Acidobacteriota bacterium]|nr:hypothetical protein [Acidobacteriota bacterium]
MSDPGECGDWSEIKTEKDAAHRGMVGGAVHLMCRNAGHDPLGRDPYTLSQMMLQRSYPQVTAQY